MHCSECEEEIYLKEAPFGSDVRCTNCGTLLETDWDYTDSDGGMTFWVVGPSREGDSDG